MSKAKGYYKIALVLEQVAQRSQKLAFNQLRSLLNTNRIGIAKKVYVSLHPIGTVRILFCAAKKRTEHPCEGNRN